MLATAQQYNSTERTFCVFASQFMTTTTMLDDYGHAATV
jgi:hypothetical protein